MCLQYSHEERLLPQCFSVNKGSTGQGFSLYPVPYVTAKARLAELVQFQLSTDRLVHRISSIQIPVCLLTSVLQ